MKIGQVISASNPKGDSFTGTIVSVSNNQVVVELFPDSEKLFFDIYSFLEPVSRLKFTKRYGSYRLADFVTVKLHY